MHAQQVLLVPDGACLQPSKEYVSVKNVCQRLAGLPHLSRKDNRTCHLAMHV